jgi:hypothetical protein
MFDTAGTSTKGTISMKDDDEEQSLARSHVAQKGADANAPSSSMPVCASDFDCHLGGVCTHAGTCTCDPAWRGSTCELLNVGAGAIAYQPPNRSSWGGGPPVLSPIDHKYHLYVSEMGGHCGLNVWQSMSTIVDTVSTTASAAGPFTRVGVVIPKEAHNAYYAYDRASQTHLIYHIGNADAGDKPPLWTNCTNGTTPRAAASARR